MLPLLVISLSVRSGHAVETFNPNLPPPLAPNTGNGMDGAPAQPCEERLGQDCRRRGGGSPSAAAEIRIDDPAQQYSRVNIPPAGVQRASSEPPGGKSSSGADGRFKEDGPSASLLRRESADPSAERPAVSAESTSAPETTSALSEETVLKSFQKMTLAWLVGGRKHQRRKGAAAGVAPNQPASQRRSVLSFLQLGETVASERFEPLAQRGSTTFDEAGTYAASEDVDGPDQKSAGLFELGRPHRSAKESVKTNATKCDPNAQTKDKHAACSEKEEAKKYECDFSVCDMACCCSTPQMFHYGIKLYLLLMNRLESLMEAWSAIEQGFAESSAKSDHEAAHMKRSRKHREQMKFEVRLLAMGLPLLSLLIAKFDGQLRGASNKRAKRLKAYMAGDVVIRNTNELEDDGTEEFKLKKELLTYLAPRELDRLGGVQNACIAKVSGVSAFQWMLTNSLGLGFYHFLMKDPISVTICVLGRSGRILVVTKLPMLDTKKACRVFRNAGLCILGITCLVHIFFTSQVKRVIDMKESKDASMREEGAKLAAQCLLGHCVNARRSTMLCFVVMWLLVFAYFKLRIRPWGTTDDRNYYESKDACCGQYFRTGSRGIIPCLSPRRRRGCLRIFFGPYPETFLFQFMARDEAVLRNFSPMMFLPRDADNGIAEPGTGQTSEDDDAAGKIQLVLALISGGLGLFGLLVTALHLVNLSQNILLCPAGNQVQTCVTGTEGDCTLVARSGWFGYHLLSHGILPPEKSTEQKLGSAVKIETLRSWLGQDDIKDAQDMVVEIARSACNARFEEYMLEPNATLEMAQADTMSKFNAENFLSFAQKHNFNITWEEKTYHCTGCAATIVVSYFTDLENCVELFEILLLVATAYLQSLLYQMLHNKLANCPMVDMPFETNPGAPEDISIEVLEKSCMEMIGASFFFRYTFGGVPKHIQLLEKRLVKDQAKEDTEKLKDPWKYSNAPADWGKYDLTDRLKTRMMIVNKECLGILEGEEIVGAWTEITPLSTRQKQAMAVGFILLVIAPWGYFQQMGYRAVCGIEACCLTALYIKLVDYFILKRRPQAGFVMTSRRIFQITRKPPYRDIFGITEPYVKLDVVVHNSSLSYSCMTMESFVPLSRRCLLKCQGLPAYRRGQVICQGSQGIFAIKRTAGETAYLSANLSRLSLTQPVPSITPQMGRQLRETEKDIVQKEGLSEKALDMPDPACSSLCCPYTPPPLGVDKDTPFLERYIKPQKGEVNIYDRQLGARPASCGELCCGRGCNCECSFCCCCVLDEVVNEFAITQRRLVVEHRAVQRYCRLCKCCKKTPVIRATYMAHYRSAAYVAVKPIAPRGINSLKVDLCVKLLPSLERHYPAGMMLHNRPYMIVKADQIGEEKAWIGSIYTIYDKVTGAGPINENPSSSEGSGSEEDSDEEGEHSVAMGDDGNFGNFGMGSGGEKGGKGKTGKKGKKGKQGKRARPADDVMSDDGRGLGFGRPDEGKVGKGKTGRGKGKGEGGGTGDVGPSPPRAARREESGEEDQGILGAIGFGGGADDSDDSGDGDSRAARRRARRGRRR